MDNENKKLRRRIKRLESDCVELSRLNGELERKNRRIGDNELSQVETLFVFIEYCNKIFNPYPKEEIMKAAVVFAKANDLGVPSEGFTANAVMPAVEEGDPEEEEKTLIH